MAPAEDAVIGGVKEEVVQVGHDGFPSLGLDEPHDIAVGLGMELDEYLSDYAYARPARRFEPREGVEGGDYFVQRP
jgi:hypothetical protein